MSGGVEIPVRVVAVEPAAATVKRFRLARGDGGPLPPFSAGSHVVVSFPAEGRTVRNPYSLMERSADGGTYAIGVLRTAQSRGGSAYLHEAVHVGSELTLSTPVNLFPLALTGRKHILVAGGIGVTPVFAMAEALRRRSAPYEIHYAMRDAAHGAFADELAARHGDRLRLYRDDRQETIAVAAVLEHQPLGAHLYVCGPGGMIDAVLSAARAAGWPDENLHAERFLAPAGGAPFRVALAKAGITAEVGPHQSLLEAIEAAGVDAPYLCRGGACGQCETAVVGFDGELLHQDHYLTEPERASGAKIMICVSRLKGRELVLDL